MAIVPSPTRANLWEKAAGVAFAPSNGRFGAIDSGGGIPLLSVLLAVKVTLGSWVMVQLLGRLRGFLQPSG